MARLVRKSRGGLSSSGTWGTDLCTLGEGHHGQAGHREQGRAGWGAHQVHGVSTCVHWGGGTGDDTMARLVRESRGGLAGWLIRYMGYALVLCQKKTEHSISDLIHILKFHLYCIF